MCIYPGIADPRRLTIIVVIWGYVGVRWGYVGLGGVMWAWVGLCGVGGVIWGWVGLCGVIWGWVYANNLTALSHLQNITLLMPVRSYKIVR